MNWLALIGVIGALCLISSAILGAGVSILWLIDRRKVKVGRAERRNRHTDNVIQFRAREVAVDDQPIHFVPMSVRKAQEAADEQRHIEWVMTNYPLAKNEVLLPPDSLGGRILNFRNN